MIIFLYGPELYLKFQKQKDIINQYRGKHSHLTIDKFDLEDEVGLINFKSFISSVSLFDAFKLAVVKNPFCKETTSLIKSYLNSKEVILLLIADNKPLKDYSFLLEKPVIFQEFNLLRGSVWKKFVNQEALKRGLKLQIGFLNDLFSHYEGDCWGLINELDKLALSKSPNSAVNFYLKYNFFSLINNLSKGTTKEKVLALEVLLQQKEDPAKIFNVLAFNINVEGKKIMADYDIAVKSGKLDYEAVLTDLAIK